MLTDEPISGLLTGSPLTGAELCVMVQSGTTYQFTLSQLITLFATRYQEDQRTVTGTTMTLSHVPISYLLIFISGQKATIGLDYNITGNVITFLYSLSTQLVTASYNY